MAAPVGETPKFAQVYTLDPNEAKKLRADNINKVLNKSIRQEIIDELEKILRDNHPYAKTFMTAAEKVKETEQCRGKVPEFQVLIFTLSHTFLSIVYI